MDCRQRLIDDARIMLQRLEANAASQAADVMRLPASAYADADLFE
ncbi:MAG: hypothetical protein RIQ46_1816, partial [Pseudomonadota bacterium]